MVETSSATLLEQLDPLRTRIDGALARYTEFSADCPPDLREAMRHSLLAPGKRLRPLLVVLAAEACGGSEAAALPAACAVEMVHAYSLIHDDLPAMDDDDLRRGQPTCHRAFGEALAILAGDALLTLAFEVLARDVQPPAVAARCCAELAAAAGACSMVGGQADDIRPCGTGVPPVVPAKHTSNGHVDHESLHWLERIHRRKTGAMFLASLRLGGLVGLGCNGGADADRLSALDKFGKRIGLAFQIVDDLLDVAGDPELVGKRLGKDHGRGKLTFPGLLGVEESTRRARVLIDEACAALSPLKPKASRLEALARYVLERNL